jgi:hypothetical protein
VEKDAFRQVTGPVMARAVAAGRLRADFTFDDFILVTRGIMANMNTPDWRRQLELTLDGLR